MSEKAIRFSVSNQRGQRSATWKCFAPKGKDDVYLICREFNGAMKASFHESGQWHIAYDRAFVDKEVPEDSDLFLDRTTSAWAQPKELCPGVMHVYRVVVPEEAVTIPKHEVKRPIFWIPAPPPGKVVEISIFFTYPEAKISSWPGANSMGTILVGNFELESGKKVWTVYRIYTLRLKLPSRGKPTFFKSSSEEDLKRQGLRAILVGKNPDGSRYFLEYPIKSAKINK